MIINKNNILHIQEPEHNDQLVWIDILYGIRYTQTGIYL